MSEARKKSTIVRRLEAKVKAMAKTRDRLRKQVEDFEAVLESSQEAANDLDWVISDLERAIDTLSEHL